MASLLKPYSPEVLLDVGCGDGTGLLALKAECSPTSRIISFDDNLFCLRKAHAQITGCGLKAKLIERFSQAEAGESFHRVAVQPGKLPMLIDDADITLIQADAIWDSEFKSFLARMPKFDAITVWLIGTHDLKPQCRNFPHQCEGGSIG